MTIARLNWTEAFTNVNQIEEYQVFRSVSVLPTALNFLQGFTHLVTLEVERDPFGEITFNPLTYDDATVDFTTQFYHYYVLAVPTRVGEASSPQTPPSRSNILVLAEPPSTVVLGGVFVPAGPSFDLSWTASSPGLASLDRYCVFRSEDGGPFILLAEVPIGTTVYSDTTVDRDNHVYAYYVFAYDSLGVLGAPSNIVTLTGTVPLFMAFGVGSENVWTSENGINNWVERVTGATIPTINAVAFSPSLQRAVLAGSNGNILYTDDGVDFTEIGPLDGFPRNISIAWSPTLSLFAMFNDTEAGLRVQTSPDGITWTPRTTPANVAWRGIWVPWANGGAGAFIAGGTNGNIMWSADGITWTGFVVGTANLDGLMDNGSRLASWNRADITNHSTDGGDPILSGSWRQSGNSLGGGYTCGATNPDGSDNFVISTAPKFFASNGKVAIDADGFGTWTKLALPNVEQKWEGMTFSPDLDRYVAVANNINDFLNTQLCMYSDDGGITWDLGTTPNWSPIVDEVGYALFGPAPPTSPVLSAVENVPLAQIELTWTASTSSDPIAQYLIYRGVDAAAPGLYAAVDGATLTYNDTLIDTGLHTYAYYVIAIDSAGLVSEPSNTETI